MRKKPEREKFLYKIRPIDGEMHASLSGLTDEPAPPGFVWRVFDPKHAVERLDALESEVIKINKRLPKPPAPEPWQETAADVAALIALRHGSGGANDPKVKRLYGIRDEAEALLKDES